MISWNISDLVDVSYVHEYTLFYCTLLQGDSVGLYGVGTAQLRFPSHSRLPRLQMSSADADCETTDGGPMGRFTSGSGTVRRVPSTIMIGYSLLFEFGKFSNRRVPSWSRVLGTTGGSSLESQCQHYEETECVRRDSVPVLNGLQTPEWQLQTVEVVQETWGKK